MLGKTIKKLRMDRGLTQQELADKLDLDRKTIINAESDAGTHLEVLERIADALGASLMMVSKSSKFYKVMLSKLPAKNEGN